MDGFGNKPVKMPLHPCVGCVYYKACGNTNRTAPCYGRVTKSERNKDGKRTAAD